MERQKILGLIVLALAVLGIGFYAATRPMPAKAPGTVQNLPLPAGSYTEHAPYYDIVANYATSTPLAAQANAAAIRTMQQFVADTIGEFKQNGNFDSLTQKDVQMFGYDQGRKQTLNIVYLIGSSTNTVSYIYTIYMDTLGAHGNTTFKTFTFDVRSGALLSLSDLFLSGADYLSKLSSLSRSALTASLGDALNTPMLDDGTTPQADNFADFFLDNRDLVILFAPYQAAPYAAGPQTVRIPLSELSDILKPAYR